MQFCPHLFKPNKRAALYDYELIVCQYLIITVMLQTVGRLDGKFVRCWQKLRKERDLLFHQHQGFVSCRGQQHQLPGLAACLIRPSKIVENFIPARSTVCNYAVDKHYHALIFTHLFCTLIRQLTEQCSGSVMQLRHFPEA